MNVRICMYSCNLFYFIAEAKVICLNCLNFLKKHIKSDPLNSFCPTNETLSLAHNSKIPFFWFNSFHRRVIRINNTKMLARCHTSEIPMIYQWFHISFTLSTLAYDNNCNNKIIIQIIWSNWNKKKHAKNTHTHAHTPIW